MEEGSEAHMDTGVSSTTEDGQEAPASSHRAVETVVIVESVKEEEMSPNKRAPDMKSPDKVIPLKPVKLPQQQEMAFKKILIKSPSKDLQVVSVPRSPSKPQEPKKSGSTEAPKSLPSSPQKLESAAVSSSKLTKQESPRKTGEVTVQNAAVDNSVQQNKQGAPRVEPIKIILNRKSADSPGKAVAVKLTADKNASKEQQNGNPSQSDSTKPGPDKPPIKIIISKDSVVKNIPVKELAIVPSVETTLKTANEIQIPNKEKQVAVKEKQTLINEIQSPQKEKQPHITNKQSPAKEVPTKGQEKEVDVNMKTVPEKEQTNITTSVEEIPSKINTTESKSTPSKLNTSELKSTPSKLNTSEFKSTPSKVNTSESKSTPSKLNTSEVKSTPSKVNTSESKTTPTKNKLEEPIKNKNLSLMEDADASNDSQLETCSETSEKEHKSISRELRSLINSAKESKIISECTQLTSKTRKSRSAVDSANTSLSSPAESEKLQHVRRYSCSSQKSTSSDKSEKTRAKRSMRSLNHDMTKAMNLNSPSGKPGKDEEASDVESQDKPSNERESTPSLPKKKKANQDSQDSESDKGTPDKGPPESGLRSDPYCWRCHWPVQPPEDEKQLPNISCSVCPRSFHNKCLTGPERNKVHPGKSWVCPECLAILQAESSESRSPAMKKISLGMLCDLLKYALERMMEVNGVEPFTRPVDRKAFPDYDKYVIHPMDLGLMKKQIDEGLYGSTEAFLADAQWIQHNSIIFNTLQAKLTAGARALVRSCRAEMSEIEACPECYAAAHARRPTWFTDVCSTPHILLWAKLKGFPYWPAKGMSINSQGLVDVRFFGAHDRAWVPARDCFLYSEKDPNNFRTKRQDILDSMQEAEQHIRNISRKYGKFVYPPFKTQFDPSKLGEQIKLMIPSFEGEVRTPVKVKPSASCPGTPVSFKQRSNSKGSKAINEGDVSEGEENISVTSVRKMADGGVIAQDDVDFTVDKDKEKSKPMEVDTPATKEIEAPVTRKRRRSQLEEAVITIIDTGKEKRRRPSRAASAGPPLNKRPKTPIVNKSLIENKDDDKTKNIDTPAKAKEPDPKAKAAEPSTSTDDKKANPKVGPIVCHRVISIAKVMKTGKTSPVVSIIKPKDDIIINNAEKATASKEENISKKDEDKQEKTTDETPSKKAKPDKTAEKDKTTPQEEKNTRRRISTKNKSLNSSTTKADKNNEKPAETKEKSKENASKPDGSKSNGSKKDGEPIDDDTSLAVLARVAKNNTTPGLPTITSVRSLSNTQGSKSLEVTVEATSSSSIFTPTSTDNVRNMKEAMNKLQRLRGENEKQSPKQKQVSNEKQGPEKPSQVGKVGVRAFARMTSPPEKETRQNDVQVDIKAEPIEYEETERQMKEKMEMMSQFKLRPVNPQAANLREVRINKVVVTPAAARKGAGSQTPPQPSPQPTRAKKTFPQPKKPDEGRSELTCKNSMVYIPIQPPVTQAPIRGARPVGTPTPSTPPQPRAATPLNNTSVTNSTVNTLTSPQVNFSSPSTSATSSAVSTPVQGIPTVGQVPSTVHTMPLITSVNGQWTFSLQPVLSVGGVDNTSSPPMVNGIGERGPLLPIAGAGGVLVPTGLSPAPTALAPPTPAAGPSRNNSDVTSTPPREPPRLQQRPSLVNPLDANAPLGNIPPPSTVGPITAKLNQNAVKMTDFFRSLLEDSIEKIDEPTAQLTALKLQLEQSQWRHKQEIDEIKHNHELMLAEMRASFEKEKQRMLTETRRLSQIELDSAVKSAKAKQWCANCNQEAQFYCCWNTSYCDYGCQRAHWATHYAVCTQPRSDGSNPESNAPERLQAAPDNLPKTTAAPNMTISKLQPGRVYTQEQSSQGQKPSIIVSMVEDASGNQTMKCVGTFKPPGSGAPPNMSPLILNKQTAVMKKADGGMVAAEQIVKQTSKNSPTVSSNPSALQIVIPKYQSKPTIFTAPSVTQIVVPKTHSNSTISTASTTQNLVFPQSKPTIFTAPSATQIVVPTTHSKLTVVSTASSEKHLVIRKCQSKPTIFTAPSATQIVVPKTYSNLITTASSAQNIVIPKYHNNPIISSTKSAAAKIVVRKHQDKPTDLPTPSLSEQMRLKPQNKVIISTAPSPQHVVNPKSHNKPIKPTISSTKSAAEIVIRKPDRPIYSSAPSSTQNIVTSKPQNKLTVSAAASPQLVVIPQPQCIPNISSTKSAAETVIRKPDKPNYSSDPSSTQIVTSKPQNKLTVSAGASPQLVVIPKSHNKPTISSTSSAATQMMIQTPQDKPTYSSAPSSTQIVTSKPQNKLTVSAAASPQLVVIPQPQCIPTISSTKSAAEIVIRKPDKPTYSSAPSSRQKVTSIPQNKRTISKKHLKIPKTKYKRILSPALSAARIISSKSQNKPTITSVSPSSQLVMSTPQNKPTITSVSPSSQLLMSKPRNEATISSAPPTQHLRVPKTQNKHIISSASLGVQIMPSKSQNMSTITSAPASSQLVMSKSQNEPTVSSATSVTTAAHIMTPKNQNLPTISPICSATQIITSAQNKPAFSQESQQTPTVSSTLSAETIVTSESQIEPTTSSAPSTSPIESWESAGLSQTTRLTILTTIMGLASRSYSSLLLYYMLLDEFDESDYDEDDYDDSWFSSSSSD